MACHEIAQRNLPLLFVGAGLPQVAALAGKAKSYAERLFDYPEVGPLDPEAARAAIVIPARNEGVSFDDGAVDAILQATWNYPYFHPGVGIPGVEPRTVEPDRARSRGGRHP